MQDPKDKNPVTCNFCGKVTKGGIYRAKQHQVGNFKNAKNCKKCSQDVKDELPNYMYKRKSLRNDFPSLFDFEFDVYMSEIDDEDEEDNHGKRVIGK